MTFGEWVRQRRKALDLTQAALGRRAGCAAITIQKIEAGERRPSRQVAELLAAALEVPPGERPVFARWARGEAPARPLSPGVEAATSPPAQGGPPHNLPAEPNVFVGRQRALGELAGLLAAGRLVTLTGPGGTGKTRLALQTARIALPAFGDGVFFVSLASLRKPEQVALAVADALGVKTADRAGPLPALRRTLRPKRLLLVMDNSEHLLSAAPLAGELLAEAPEVKILATSREALGLYGEQEYAVPPLAVPAAHRPELWPALGQVEAVALFVQRAQAAQPAFALSADTATAVAEICLRLDGLPLALELAAARMKVFTPVELLQRLAAGLPALAGGPRNAPLRQQTLRDTIAWSYQLLPEEERTLFASLAVFAGGFDLEAAEAVCGARAVEGVAALVHKSLVQREADGAERSRFRLLETIRDYALEKSVGAREPAAEALRQRHLEYFTRLAETAAGEILGAGQAAWLDRMASEHANLEAALAWSLVASAGAAAEAGLDLAGWLGWYWHFRGHWTEGRRWLAQLLARGEGDAEAQARALCAAGLLAWAQDDYAEAKARLGAGLGLLPEGQATPTRAHAMGILGLVLLYEANVAAAEPLFDQALAMFRGLRDPFGVGVSLIRVGLAARLRGDLARAAQASEESLALYERLENAWGTATASANLGEIALDQGDWRAAARHYRRALAALQPMGSQWYTALHLVGVAGVAALGGAPREAARLLGVAEALVHSVDGTMPALDRQMSERYWALAQAALGEGEFEAARAEGEAAGPSTWQEWVAGVLRAEQAEEA